MEPNSDQRQRSTGRPSPEDILPQQANSPPLEQTNIQSSNEVEIDRLSESLLFAIKGKQWRRTQKQLELVTTSERLSDEDRQIVLGRKSDQNLSILQGLLQYSAPIWLIKKFVNANIPFAQPQELNAAVTLVSSTDLDVSYALSKGRYEQAHVLINAGAPVQYADIDGNSALHQVEATLAVANMSYVDFLSAGLCQSILSAAPELLSHRNLAQELPITCFAKSGQWAAVEVLAREHSREAEISLSLEESYAIYIWALTNDAPLSTLKALDPLSDFCPEQNSLDGIPTAMRGVLFIPLFSTSPGMEASLHFNTPYWNRLKPILRFIEKHRELIPEVLTSALLNASFPDPRLQSDNIRKRNPLDPPLIYWATYLEAETDLIIKLIELGADPRIRFDYLHNPSKRFFEGCSLMHVVVFEENNALWKELPRRGELVNLANDEGELPVHMYAAETANRDGDSLKIAAAWIRRVLRESDSPDPKTQNQQQLNIADILLIESSFQLFLALESTISPPTSIDLEGEYPLVGEEDETLTGDWLLKQALYSLQHASSEVREEAASFLEHSNSLYDFYLYSAAYSHHKDLADAGAALVKLMPALLWKYPHKQVEHLMGAIEGFNDDLMYSGHRPVAHPSEAEMLLLLNHPRLPSLGSEHTNFVTSVFTSIPRFIDEKPDQIPLQNIQAIENWQRVGTLTHSHLRYKFDSRPAKDGATSIPPLLEEFGLGSIKPRWTDVGDARENIPPLGRGLLLSGMMFDGLERKYQSGLNGSVTSFSTDTIIELRQGYFLIAHPDSGTLVIRNSSLVFGRDALLHPASWSPVSIGNDVSLQEILDITVDQIDYSMMHIGHINIHRPEVTETNNKSISYLLDQFKIFQAEYRHWKFNTDSETAFTDINGRRKLSDTGAWKAPGFTHVVQRLNCWLGGTATSIPDQATIADQPPLALAFAHPHLPPWSTHMFIDERGNEQRRLSINEERLTVLNRLVKGTATRHELIDSGVQSFFQVAGINTHGELLVVNDQQSFERGRDE